jgi:hypothetical protein
MAAVAARRVSTCAFIGALALGFSSPAAAAQREEDRRALKPSAETTIAASVAFVPTAPAPIFATDAQSITNTLPTPRRDSGLSGTTLRRSLIVSFGALQMLDAHSTAKALSAGGREANPVMAGLASNRTALFAVKAGTAAATAYFAERLSRKHPRRALVLMAVLNSAYAGIVAHNYRVARGQ